MIYIQSALLSLILSCDSFVSFPYLSNLKLTGTLKDPRNSQAGAGSLLKCLTVHDFPQVVGMMVVDGGGDAITKRTRPPFVRIVVAGEDHGLLALIIGTEIESSLRKMAMIYHVVTTHSPLVRIIAAGVDHDMLTLIIATAIESSLKKMAMICYMVTTHPLLVRIAGAGEGRVPKTRGTEAFIEDSSKKIKCSDLKS